MTANENVLKEHYFYDPEKNVVLKMTEKNMNGRNKKNIIPISNRIKKFKSADGKYIFEKDLETKKFKKTKILRSPPKRKVSSPSVSKSKALTRVGNPSGSKMSPIKNMKKECKNKKMLYDPVINDCVEDTPYNQILIKRKMKDLHQKTKTPPLTNRKAQDLSINTSSDISMDLDLQLETCITKSKVTLKEHQLKAVKRLLLPNIRGLIASFGVGTGKTLTAVATAECLLDKNIAQKVIVSSPKSLLNNFRKELIKYLYGENVDVNTIDDSIFSRYEFITHDGIKKKFLELKNLPEASKEDIFFIVDEAHEMRTALNYDKDQARKSSFFMEMSLISKKILLLTATPFINNRNDLLNLINAVKGGIPYHITEYPTTQREKDIFLNNTFMFFELDKNDTYISGMPTKEIVNKEFIMSPKYYNAYMEIERGLNINWENPEVFLSGLRQATNTLDGNPKIEWIIDFITSRPDDKTLIFSSFLESGVKKIQSALHERNIPFVEVTGEGSVEERNKAVEKYNTDQVKIFFITKAGGAGLDLKKTNNVILFESNWNNSQEEQVIGRAVRIGSHSLLPPEKRHVMVYKLILKKPGIDIDKRKELFKVKRLSSGSADEIIQYLNEKKKVDENDTLKELREYAYE